MLPIQVSPQYGFTNERQQPLLPTPNSNSHLNRLADTPLLDETEFQKLQTVWEAKPQSGSKDRYVHELFEIQAFQNPNAVAVVWQATALSYAAVNQRANQLAHYLRRLGVGPETIVGLCLERSEAMVVAVLAVLKAGGAYLPLDPMYPSERLAYMLADSQASLLVTDAQSIKRLPAHAAQVICLDTEWATITQESSENPTRNLLPDNLAYLIYTSGSTGRPKGVMVTHRSLVNIYAAWETVYQLQTAVRSHLQMASISFDVFAADLIRALCSGAKLVICPREILLTPAALAALIRQEQVDFGDFVPAVLRNLVQYLETSGQRLESLRIVVCGSDSWFASEYQKFQRFGAPTMRLINAFGLTEATIDSSYFETRQIDLATDQLVPIGQPFANTQLYVLTGALAPAPLGVAGELYIGGAGLARGYRQRPELTAERFVPNPFSATPGERLYRTGDLARYRADGQLEFLGRADNQVKVRGFRIELGEIEAALTAHPAVAQAVVIVREDAPEVKRLTAYLTLSATAGQMEQGTLVNDLRQHLGQRLPDYMTPAAFVVLEQFALTPNGKIDRRNLPAPAGMDSVLGANYVAPRTDVETTLARIWGEALHLSQVGIHDHFLALGGDSILSVQVIVRAQAAGLHLTLTQLLQHPTIAELATVVATDAPAPAEIAPLAFTPSQAQFLAERNALSISDAYPLSPMQQGMLFHTLYAPMSGEYITQTRLAIRGRLDVVAFHQAWEHLLARHAILRTAVVWEGLDQPLQLVQSTVALPLVQLDWRELTPEMQELDIHTYMEDERQRGFALDQAPLMRLTLVHLAEESYQLLWSYHHLLLDGWSLALLLQEFRTCYAAFSQNQMPELPPVQPYRHYIAWLQQQSQAAAEGFWRRTLQGFTAPTPFSVDRALTKEQESATASMAGHRYAAQEIQLAPAVTLALQTLARQNQLTLSTLLQGAWALLLSRYSGEANVVFGNVVAGRSPEVTGVESMIGLFINTLPVRAAITPNASILPWLHTLQTQQMQARQYDHSALAQIQRWSELPLGAPLFESILVFQNYAEESALTNQASNVLFQDMRSPNWTNFPLTLTVEPRPALLLEITYNCQRFDAATITRMLGHLQTILTNMVAQPEQPLAAIPLLTTNEHQQILVDWNATQAAVPQNLCIHELFEAQAAQTPDAVALVWQANRFSYAALNRRANQLAHYLRRLGVGPETLVGLCLERSADMVVAVLAILKAGGAYLPLDPMYPADRLAYMLTDSKAPVLVTDQQSLKRLPDLGAQVVCLDTDWPTVAQESGENLVRSGLPDNLAYVIYTSGSTGKPKGVMIKHATVINFLTSMRAHLGINAQDRLLSVTTLSFDIAALELFLPLMVGARIELVSRATAMDAMQLMAVITTSQATFMQATPATWRMLLAANWAGKHDLTILCGGEALPRDLAEQCLKRSKALWNLYGPTETTIWSCVHQVQAGEWPIPIGGGPTGVVANTQLYVLNGALQPAPVGVAGELYIGGDGLARGYLQRPELTADRFVPNPFAMTPGERIYRTGDLARYRADGQVEFLGRADNQVKVRGFRIELGEIEAALTAHPAVAQAVAIVREDTPEVKRLVAYLVLDKATMDTESTSAAAQADEAVLVSDLRQQLGERLPDYMVPTAFMVLAQFPLTPNGKVDRRALPAPQGMAAITGANYVAPQTAVEMMLARIWGEVLHLPQIGIHDHFLALGGDSILSIQVIVRAKAAGLHLTLAQLLQHPTIAELATVVETDAGTAEIAPLALTPSQEQFLSTCTVAQISDAYPLSSMQQGMLFRTLYAPTSGEYISQSRFAIRGKLDLVAFRQAWEYLLARHASLRTAVAWEGLDQPLQLVQPTVALPLLHLDWREVALDEQEMDIHAYMEGERQRGFVLDQAPLMRLTLFHLADDSYQLLWSYHHLLLDGWSLALLLQEFRACYAAFCQKQTPDLPPVQPYRHYIAWLQQQPQAPAEAFWRRTLQSFTAPTPLTTVIGGSMAARSALFPDESGRETKVVSQETMAALQTLARQHQLTLNTLVQGAWALLLNRYTHEQDVVFGNVVAGRPPELPGVENMVGLFINTLPVRVRMAPSSSLISWLQELQMQQAQTRAYESSPLAQLQRWSEVSPGQPLFESLLVFQNYPGDQSGDGATEHPHTIQLQGLPAAAAAKYPLTLVVEPGAAWSFEIEYQRSHFLPETVSRLLGHLCTILESMIADPTQRLADISLLTETEQQQLLKVWDSQTDQGEALGDAGQNQTIEQLLAQLDDLSSTEVDALLQQMLAEGELAL